MPVYQYACTECGEQLEVRQSFTDDSLSECPACEGRLRKVLSAVGVVFKGSGFYRNDSRDSRSTAGGDGSSDGGDSGGDSSKSKESRTKSDGTSGGDKAGVGASTSGSKESSSGSSSSSTSAGTASKATSSTGSRSSTPKAAH